MANTFSKNGQASDIMRDRHNEQQQKAAMFKALGDPTRLRIFEILCSCSNSTSADTLDIDKSGDIRVLRGPTVKEICCQLNGVDHITSTISHHLKELRQAGLITMERSGKHFICSINQVNVDELVMYFINHTQRTDNDTCCTCEKN
jgi:ArsR family transcriptional regulator